MKTPGKLNWGILGTGAIAAKFSSGLVGSETGTLVAIGSRTHESAAKFASNFPGSTAHGSYEALLADENVQAVYISTPHPMHAEWAIKAARAGKHILCEKPLAMNHAEAKSIVDAAKRAGVFLMEGFMYRCHPQTRKIVELVRDKVVGEILLVRANFSFRADYDLKSRLLCGALGGGGILDVGCYCVSMARLIAGEEPAALFGAGRIGAESCVDEFAIASLKFPGGMLAQIAAGVQLTLENDVWLFGTEGQIEITNPWFGNGKVIVRKNGVSDPEEIEVHSDRSVYALEADEVAANLVRRESPAMSWADSLGNMKTLDLWREAVGMVYNFETRERF
ncbi:MAG: Gfo/Idh/MocA family oxidoreductase [Verrucomicrobiota bacterium]|nr:Gfo/Idh/MocA family oxidoreductase [Verrucomicrobiota bacterium]